MPVSFFPLVVWALLLGVPSVFLVRRGRRAFLWSSVGSIVCLASALGFAYVPGWALMREAHRGDAAAQYAFARWSENHCDEINSVVLWPCGPDVEAGYEWLERSARQDHPPALYSLGVRLKYGQFVPEPAGWDGPAGNVFPQPERGQRLIDRAIALGYRPSTSEETFYWVNFRESGGTGDL